MSKVLCFTLSLHALISVWYFYRLITALSPSDSNKSLSSALVVQDIDSDIIRNGEKFVVLVTDVL
jgi:hypothetical protein